jgi:hypothetical protein
VKILSNQKTNSQKSNKNAIISPQGSGSEYHRKHASNVPDYGANNIDPNVKMSNITDHTDQ